jgi:hypothetical protein
LLRLSPRSRKDSAEPDQLQEGHFATYWRVYAKHSPRLVIDGVAVVIFYAGTLAYLTRQRVAMQFSMR